MINLYRLRHKETGLFHAGKTRWRWFHVNSGRSCLSKNGKFYQRRGDVLLRSKSNYDHRGPHPANSDDWELEEYMLTRIEQTNLLK